MDEAILKIEGLEKSFGELKVLKGIDLTVKPVFFRQFGCAVEAALFLEIGIQIFHLVFLGNFLPQGIQNTGILVGAYRQGGCEIIKTIALCIGCSLC